MTTEKFQTTLKAPMEIAWPADLAQDHGLTLTHDLHGTPRAYMHEISIRSDRADILTLAQERGYAQKYGWISKTDGAHRWLYHRAFPVSVASWE